jgi:hypothetical protein
MGVYTHNVFKIFQGEVIVARDQCFIVGIVQQEGIKIVKINDVPMRDRVVQWCTTILFGNCSCKQFERIGIPYRYIILTLRGEKSILTTFVLYFKEMGDKMQEIKEIIFYLMLLGFIVVRRHWFYCLLL